MYLECNNFTLVGCGTWTRTKITSSRGRCPTIRRFRNNIAQSDHSDTLQYGENIANLAQKCTHGDLLHYFINEYNKSRF